MSKNNAWNSDIPVSVPKGGTGRISNVSYSVLCGGTSPINPIQNVAILGEAGKVLTSNGASTLPTFQNAPVSISAFPIILKASDFELNVADFADLLLQSGTTVKRKVLAFANATDDQEEFANFATHVPADIDTTGTVTIRLYVTAATAAASKNVEFRLSYIPLNGGEDFDVAYTTVDSGDVAINATQDHQTELTFTFAASTLASDDQFEGMISRIAASSNDLTGDAYVRTASFEFPLG